MIDINKNVKTVCSFYASDWHLVTMLLPNIDKKIDKEIKIATLFENNLTQRISTLLGKLKLQNERKILNIKWSQTHIEDVNFKELLSGEYEIIINGSLEYINNVHEKIEEYLRNNKIDKQITILDCYDISECTERIKDILDKHDKILNTGGEKEKDEYIMNIQIAN